MEHKSPISPRDLKLLKQECSGDSERLDRMLKRMRAGDCVEYVLCYQFFDNRKYFCDRRAYIAQGDSVYFLHKLENEICSIFKRLERPITICEVGVGVGVGVGGGALTSSLLYRLNDKLPLDAIECVIGCDIDPAALEVAKRNFIEHSQLVSLFESDVLTQIPRDQNIDVIFAYPPWGLYDPGDKEFHDSEWAHFHSAVPPISCYAYDTDSTVHRDIIQQSLSKYPTASFFIFNDVLPAEATTAICSTYKSIDLEPCGPKMTMFARRV